jgi:hypothetical protein
VLHGRAAPGQRRPLTQPRRARPSAEGQPLCAVHALASPPEGPGAARAVSTDPCPLKGRVRPPRSCRRGGQCALGRKRGIGAAQARCRRPSARQGASIAARVGRLRGMTPHFGGACHAPRRALAERSTRRLVAILTMGTASGTRPARVCRGIRKFILDTKIPKSLTILLCRDRLCRALSELPLSVETCPL